MDFRSTAEGASLPGVPFSAEDAEAAATERLLLASLPSGWSVIGRCRFGTAVPGPQATGCHALAHPAVGIALIDIAPDVTPNAESRLRRALGAAEFWPDFPGNLPVWHGRLDGASIRGLDDMLQARFAALPPLTVPGGQAWIGAVRQALGQDQAWEVPGQARRPAAPVPPPLDPDEPEEGSRRRGWVRSLPLLVFGFLGTFGLGLAVGLVLLPAPEPAEQPATPVLSVPAEAAPATPPDPVAVEYVAEPPAEAGPAPAPAASAAVAEPDPPPPEVAALATPEPPEPVAPLPRDDGMDALATPGMPIPEQTQPMVADSDAPPMPAEASELPPAPPPTPPAPALAPRRPARSDSGTDRACILALFRFQQGETLSAADQAHVRNGCMIRR